MMLDTKKVGIKIASLRKSNGYSQEKLSELLHISPQAISKWENGHTLPETSLLPVLAQIFDCTIDHIIMPAYLIEEKIEAEKQKPLTEQAEMIADKVAEKLENKISSQTAGLDDFTIADAIYKANGEIGHCIIKKGKPYKMNGNSIMKINVSAPHKNFELIQKSYLKNDTELYRYHFLERYTMQIPQVYHVDFDRKIIVLEDLSDRYIQGYCFDEKTEDGTVYRANRDTVLKSAAKLHATFWDNYRAFEQLGPEWRLQSKENILSHISSMERDYKKYRNNEESGGIPKVWEHLENNITSQKLDCFDRAAEYLRTEYPKVIDERFSAGANITVIHGDMHPGTTHLSKISKSDGRAVKFSGLQAVRTGLCTEDLAMLLALHIEPDKKRVMPLLTNYHKYLSAAAKGYSFDTFLKDYKLSIAENMFFTIRLINQKIFDFKMRDNAIKAFETFF